MNSLVQYTKGHGTKNDFILIEDLENRIDLNEKQVSQICDREKGIGADGILRITRQNNEFFMDYRNSDGSIAEMCGNGARVIAQYLFDKKLVKSNTFTFQTRAGSIHAEVHSPGDVSVTMAEAILRGKVVEVLVNGHKFNAQAVDAPNPHAVAFVEKITDSMVHEVGKFLETCPAFPKRANIEFVEVVSRNRFVMRVWERGSGETLACGTGACAVAVAGILTNRLDRKCTGKLLGGELELEWPGEGHTVYMTGPATEIFSGIWPR